MEWTADESQHPVDPPDVVFHYTAPSGLIGILRDDEIQLWASHIRFMNDDEEFAYPVRLLGTSRRPDLDERVGWQKDYLKAGLAWLESKAAKGVQVYACSFCRDGDLLSQWRGYGINNGYSLGFSGDSIRRQAEKYGDQFFRVEYGPEEGAEILEAIQLGVAYGVNPRLWGLALIKDAGFREEQEWRWVCDVEESRTEECEERSRSRSVNYRAGSMGVIPYLTFSVPKEALRKVIVGPGKHPEVREEGARRLLDGRGYKSVKVESSRIPIRL
jgi:hypothetical protein